MNCLWRITIMKLSVIIICHDQQAVDRWLTRDPSIYVIFVGPGQINTENDRVIVARNLTHNIENERKLLTFTAWYAIAKNNLFADSDYLCLFEYDVDYDITFMPRLQDYCNLIGSDVFACQCGQGYFYTDVTPSAMDDFISKKDLAYDAKENWFSFHSNHPCSLRSRNWFFTTNHCIKRGILTGFVDWYYPDCLQIKEQDEVHFSWYHERLFSVYLYGTKRRVKVINGLRHAAKASHQDFNYDYRNN